MASSSSFFLHLTFFLPSLVVLSSQTIIPKSQKISSDLLAKACKNDWKGWDTNVCLKIMKSSPKIMSSKDRVSLVVNIIDLGIENVTNTQTYIKQKLKDPKVVDQGLKSTLNECVNCFQAGIWSLNSAKLEIKEDKEYMTADYDLLVVPEQVGRCGLLLADYKFEDPKISFGMSIVVYFSNSARNIVLDLEYTSPPPPQV